ncbi:MAG: DUF2752 domain-containing protein [Phycisphaerae bacterium]|nr:DUF2752 domain-containing protein [Phycisphaerae bacterium]
MERVAHIPVFGPRVPVGAKTRLGWAGVALACVAVLGVARYLEPDARGYGTHEQLGFYPYPCSFVLTTGLPCPTCGMTTAFSFIMHGHPWLAFKSQPAGAVLCVATIGLLVLALYVVVRGRVVCVNWDRIGPVRVSVGVGLLILGGWGFKIAHGLITGTLPVR